MKLLDSEIFLWLVAPEVNELFVQRLTGFHGVNRVRLGEEERDERVQMPLFESINKSGLK